MVFDSLDIACLRSRRQLEQRKKPGQHFVPMRICSATARPASVNVSARYFS